MIDENKYKGMALADAIANLAHPNGDDVVVVKRIEKDGTERAYGIPWELREERVTVCVDHTDTIIAVYGRG